MEKTTKTNPYQYTFSPDTKEVGKKRSFSLDDAFVDDAFVDSKPVVEDVNKVATMLFKKPKAGEASPSASSLFTPEHQKQSGRANLPDTPFQGELKLDPEEIFYGNTLPLDKNNSAPFSLEDKKVYDFQGTYTDEDGHKELCVRQPQQKASCGAGALVMYLSHWMKKDPQIELSESFLNWYNSAALLKPIDLITCAQNRTNLAERNYQLKWVVFYTSDLEASENKREKRKVANLKSDLVQQLRNLQGELKAPLIIDLTNPEVGNHWVVLDKITDDRLLIRDPFKGAAYLITHEEFFQNSVSIERDGGQVKEEEIAINCLYLQKRS